MMISVAVSMEWRVRVRMVPVPVGPRLVVAVSVGTVTEIRDYQFATSLSLIFKFTEL